jgi:hypothetical protein
MKYIVAESQLKLLSELERTWRDSEYAEGYNKIKHKLIPYFENLIESYSQRDLGIHLYDSEQKKIMIYMKPSGELYYNRDLDNLYNELFPHPIWLVHSKYIMSDVFNEYFPDYEVKSVKSVNI